MQGLLFRQEAVLLKQMILFYCVRVSVQPPSSRSCSRSISVHVAAGQLASCQQQCRHQHRCSPRRPGEHHPALMYIHHCVLLTNMITNMKMYLESCLTCVAHTHSPLVMAVWRQGDVQGVVPQIDPSVPQPVVQSRRRPLLGPSPG